MTAAVPAFQLRFPLAEIPRWAAACPAAEDAEVEAIGRTARLRGSYTRDEFLVVARWKTPRSARRTERNSPGLVEEVTATALRAADERVRVGVLLLLDGVGMPTASVLLHLAHPDPYPILDVRALWSLGVGQPLADYTFDFWIAYVHACRGLARQARVSMRELDRALWQCAKEHQAAGT